MPYRPGRGCMFMLEGRSGLWRTPGDVVSSFSSSVLTITDNLVSDEEPGDPDDERFKSATVESVSLVQDLVVLRIVLTSLAGTSRTVLFPLRVSNT